MPVYLINEYDTRVSGAPGQVNYLAENLSSVEFTHYLSGAWIHQTVIGALLHGFHEHIGHSYRQVEIGQGLRVYLGLYEPQDVGMIDVEYRHVGSAAHTALLYHISSGVKGSHEGDRAAGDSAGRTHPVLLRPESRKGEPCASPALVDHRGVLDGIKDGLHRVLNRYNEACRKLSQFAASVHQSRRVGQEFQVGHQLVEGVLPRGNVDLVIELKLG